MKILFIGDICFKAGREFFTKNASRLIREYEADFVVCNGENMAGGKGINYAAAKELFNVGCDVITTGNHIWAKKEVLNFIESEERVLRPANYSPNAPGHGVIVIEKNQKKLAVINLAGQFGMIPSDNPFIMMDNLLPAIKEQTNNIFVDFHGEATSEKIAFAYYLDGKVSAVVGTHTHVQTADERVLENGTGFITDVGMTGPFEGIIGSNREIVINKFVTGISDYFTPQKGLNQINGVVIDIDEDKGICKGITRIYEIENI